LLVCLVEHQEQAVLLGTHLKKPRKGGTDSTNTRVKRLHSTVIKRKREGMKRFFIKLCHSNTVLIVSDMFYFLKVLVPHRDDAKYFSEVPFPRRDSQFYF
jgi:hypothetical protein